MSCTIWVTIQITLSDFRGHFDYQMCVMLSSKIGTKSGLKHSATSGEGGEFPGEPSLCRGFYFQDAHLNMCVSLLLRQQKEICKFFMEYQRYRKINSLKHVHISLVWVLHNSRSMMLICVVIKYLWV